jgi:hypothetical protein
MNAGDIDAYFNGIRLILRIAFGAEPATADKNEDIF